MRTFLGCCGSLIVIAFAAPAMAGPTDPPPAITITGGATLVSDYRFRGISQTDKAAAIQGTFTVAHRSGFYATVWGSSVDDYVTASGRSNAELDLILGYKRTVGGTTFDLGALYYVYPRSKLPGDRTSSNFIEPYASIGHVFGPVTAKATVNYAPKQKALALDQIGPARSNVYVAGDLSAAIPTTPFGLNAHLGHTFGPSWIAIGNGYTDWGLGATATYKALTFGVQYVDTDDSFLTPTGKNAASGGVVASLGASF